MAEENIPGPEDGGSAKATDRAAGNRSRSKELLLSRLLASLINLTLVGLGLMSVLTQSYYGRTSKLGGAEVSLHGGSAVAMGLAIVFLGLLPLALWFPSRRPALAWALACATAAAVTFCVFVYGAKPSLHRARAVAVQSSLPVRRDRPPAPSRRLRRLGSAEEDGDQERATRPWVAPGS